MMLKGEGWTKEMAKERKEKSGQTKRRKRAAMGGWGLCDRSGEAQALGREN